MTRAQRQEEYLKRNLIVCQAYGAQSCVVTALNRELASKRPRKWMLHQLDATLERIAPLIAVAVAYRKQVKP